MLTKDGILEILRDQQAYLADEFGVRRIGLFGSYARDEQTEVSDIDLLADFDSSPGLRFVELANHLESLFGKSVEVLTSAGVDSIRNPRLAARIRSSVVYA